MLFLVISSPRPDRPSEVKAKRQEYWTWIQPLLDAGIALSIHARVGRGGVALFNVDSNLTLHRLLSEWAEIVPATFDIYPLVDPDEAQAYLKVHANKAAGVVPPAG